MKLTKYKIISSLLPQFIYIHWKSQQQVRFMISPFSFQLVLIQTAWSDQICRPKAQLFCCNDQLYKLILKQLVEKLLNEKVYRIPIHECFHLYSYTLESASFLKSEVIQQNLKTGFRLCFRYPNYNEFTSTKWACINNF